MKSSAGTAETPWAILANGAMPRTKRLLSRLRAAKRLVCCDGALAKALKMGLKPFAAVGDGDSLPRALAERMGSRWRKVEEQETNDLAKAVRFVLSHGAKHVDIFAADGKRPDHFLGNIFHLFDFNYGTARVDMLTDEGDFTVIRANVQRTLHVGTGMAVSVFAADSAANVESTGLEWPLGGVSLDTLWRGTLNRALADEITISSDRPLLVFLQKKKRATA